VKSGSGRRSGRLKVEVRQMLSANMHPCSSGGAAGEKSGLVLDAQPPEAWKPLYEGLTSLRAQSIPDEDVPPDNLVQHCRRTF